MRGAAAMAKGKKAGAAPAGKSDGAELAAADVIEPSGGRPSKYKPEFARIARKMCELGATDYDLAQALDVNTSTIWRWQSEHDAFCNAVRLGKEEPDRRVERSLYQRAVGYTYNATKVMQYEGSPVFADYVEHVPPDPGAAMNWLANRKPDDWRKNADGDGAGGTITVQVVKFSPGKTENGKAKR